MTNGSPIKISDSSLSFSCTEGEGGTYAYPRATDPVSKRWLFINNVTDSSFDVQVLDTIPSTNVTSHTWISAVADGIVEATGLKYIPNEKATLNIRFTNDSAVRTQNCKLRIFDRVNKNHAASGVITRVAEIIHPNTSYAVLGSGDDTWYGSTSHSGSSTRCPFARRTVTGSLPARTVSSGAGGGRPRGARGRCAGAPWRASLRRRGSEARLALARTLRAGRKNLRRSSSSTCSASRSCRACA